ncbi:putative uncharacterized protein [Clostridium sp. CAG:354]|jgi:hypothetical protein|nr:cyclophilin-like fold protein [Clostridia bacterium]CDE10167.1 putative uncharacterized protein [Clostridium sp. CAG:354]
MKKVILIIILLIVIIGAIVVIANFDTTENIQNNNNLSQDSTENNINNVIENTDNTNDYQNLLNDGEEVSMENVRIKLIVNGNEIFVRLDDNQASRDFLEMLPLTLTLEDFNNTEKIATLPNELSTKGLPSGYTPQVGDFSYYAPWGNISVFYKDFRYSNSLYKLGTIESGTEILGNLNNDFEVTIERAN